jgi:hypothetical protein
VTLVPSLVTLVDQFSDAALFLLTPPSIDECVYLLRMWKYFRESYGIMNRLYGFPPLLERANPMITEERFGPKEMRWGKRRTRNAPVCGHSAFSLREIESSGGRSAKQKEADHEFQQILECD